MKQKVFYFDPETHNCEEIEVETNDNEQDIKNTRIKELKQMLLNTDYQAIKYAEGAITEEEYTPIKQQRQEWRDEINELEEQLKGE